MVLLFSVQLKKQMTWNDDLSDPGTEVFRKSKKEVEEQVSIAFAQKSTTKDNRWF